MHRQGRHRTHPSSGERWASLLSCAVLVLAGITAQARSESNAPPPKSSKGSASKPATQPAKPAPLSTPRVTMQQFLLAVDESKEKPERIKDAVACLDLAGLPEADRTEQGPKLALQLERILDSQGVIALDTVPNEQTGEPYAYQIEGEEAPINIARGQDGLWRFTKEAVAAIPTMHQRIAKAATTQPAAEKADTVNALYRSPRATMRTFLEAMNNGDFAAAAKCLDLSNVAEAMREETGQQLAQKLKGIIDRIREVVFQEIPDDPAAPPYAWHVDDKYGRIEITKQKTGEDREKEWLFSAETVKTIQPWYKAIEETRLIEGFEGPSFWASPSLWLRSKVPANLKEELIWLEHWQWIGIALILVIGVLIHRIVWLFLKFYVSAWLSRFHVRLDSEIQATSLRPFGIFAMVWFWWQGLKLLDLGLDAMELIGPAMKVLWILVGTWAAYRLVDLVADYLGALASRTESKLDDLVVPLARKSLKVLVVVLGIAFLVQAVSSPSAVTKFFTGLGLGGLAFALAAQDTIKNLFGSLTIILDRPFQVGDWVVIGDVEGTVETVGFRSVKIRTFYNSMITVPNSTAMNVTIDNYGARRYRRIRRMISVTYSTPPEKLEAFCEGIRELIRLHPYTRKDYFQVYVNVLDASSIDILLYCFLETPDWSTELRERHRLFLDIIRLANKLGVEFAFPTQTIHMAKDDAGEPSPIADDTKQAHEWARQHATDVITAKFGKTVTKPPPVDFSRPETFQ